MTDTVDLPWVISSSSDAQGRSLQVDPRWLEVTGQTASEALGYGWIDAIHPEDQSDMVDAMHAALERQSPARHEFRLRHKDGSYRWTMVVGAPRFDEMGEFLGYVGCLIDIHYSRQIEGSLRVRKDELRAAHERLTAALRASPIILFEQAGPDLRYLWVQNNPPGMRVDDIVGRTDHELFLAEDADLLMALKRRAIETGTPVREEVRITLDREERWFDLTIEPHRGDGAIEGVLCAASNITERKHADFALQRTQEALAIAVDGGQMGTWDINLLVSMSKSRNRRHDQIFGYDEPLDDWTPGTTRQHIIEQDKPVFDAAFAEALRSGPFAVEVRIRRRDGALRWVALRGLVSFGSDGAPVRASGVTFDIDKQKRGEETLREADRRKDEFLAILGHELRNPLAPIQNGVEALKRWLPADAPDGGRALIDMMQRQTGYLVRLVDDLLELSRVNTGVIELRRTCADLRLAVRDALETNASLIEKRGHRIVTRLAVDPLPVIGDPLRLAQIVTNLIANAAKYTAPGGRIEIDAQRRGDKVVVIVRDDGIGVAPDALPKVFDLFAQIDPPEMSEGGLGVGLALARKLVELHGGTIEALSTGLGQGAEFVVTLPVAPESETAEAVRPLAHAAEVRAPRAALRLLIVDDNHDVADSMGMLLETFGAAIRVAYDGVSGVEAAAEFRPDIAFVDIRMPGIDGYETARRVRARMGADTPKLVALTGLGPDKDNDSGPDVGFDLHLTKPVSVDALESLLRG